MTKTNKIKYGLIALALVVVVGLAAAFSGGNFLQGALYRYQQSELTQDSQTSPTTSERYLQDIQPYTQEPTLSNLSNISSNNSADSFNPGKGETMTLSYTLVSGATDTSDIIIWVYKSENYHIAWKSVENLPSGSHSFTWDGKDNQGQLQLPEENGYKFRIQATNQYGDTEWYGDSFQITSNEAAQPGINNLNISGLHDVSEYNEDVFSPNIGETVTLNYDLNTGDSDSVKVTVKAIKSSGQTGPVKSWIYESQTTGSYSVPLWDGKDDNGNISSVGEYYFFIQAVTYDQMHVVEVKSDVFRLTEHAAVSNLTLDKATFSPNVGETVKLSYDLDNGQSYLSNMMITIREDSWNDHQVGTVKSWNYNNQIAGNYTVEWDGKDNNGDLVSAVSDYYFTIDGLTEDGEDFGASSAKIDVTEATVNPPTDPTPTPTPTPDPTPTPGPIPAPDPTPTADQPTNLMTEVSTDFTAQNNTCAGFEDVVANDKDCDAIEYVKGIGAMVGTDGYFYPGDLLQRDQIAKIILEMNVLYNKRINYCLGSNPFPDVRSSDWSYQYICRGKALGIVTGYEGGEYKGLYKPANYVNRAEFLALVLRSIEETMPNANQFSYEDVSIGAWYSAFAVYSNDNGLFVGEKLNPGQAVSRREVAQILYKLYQSGNI